MSKYFIPLIALIASAGLYFVYISPLFDEIDRLKAQETEFENALQKAAQLEMVIQRLQSQFASYTPSELTQLERILPGDLNQLQLILDVDTLASQHAVEITSIEVVDNPTRNDDEDSLTIVPRTITFIAEANQASFVAFLIELEKSLQLLDVSKIGFETLSEPTAGNQQIIYSAAFTIYSLE